MVALKTIGSRKILDIPIGIFLIIISARIVTISVMAIGREYLPKAHYPQKSWMINENYLFITHLANFDGAWFIRVAALGYEKLKNGNYNLEEEKKRLKVMDEWGYQDGIKGFGYRHFPLFPYTIRALATITGEYLITGVLIANLFSFLYIIYIYKLTQLEFGEKAGWWATAFATFFPNAHYFIAIYSEGMFMTFSLGALYHARKKQWNKALVFGLLSSATRLEGIFISLGLLFILIDEKGGWKKLLSSKEKFSSLFRERMFYYCMFVPLGLLFPILEYWRVAGSPIAPYLYMQKALGVMAVFPWQAFALDFRAPNPVTLGVDVPFFVVMVILTVLSARRLSTPFAIFTIAELCARLIQPHIGILRFLIAFFGFYMYLGELGVRHPPIAKIILLACALLLGFFSILFINGYWIA